MAKITYIAEYSGKLQDGNTYTGCKLQVEEPANTSYYTTYTDVGVRVEEYRVSSQTVKAICDLYKLDSIKKLVGHDVTISGGKNNNGQKVAYMVSVIK